MLLTLPVLLIRSLLCYNKTNTTTNTSTTDTTTTINTTNFNTTTLNSTTTTAHNNEIIKIIIIRTYSDVK